LVLIFTLLFTAVFSLSFIWFYGVATGLALDNLRTDIRHIATEAAGKLDVNAYNRLATTGDATDPAYQQLTATLAAVRSDYPIVKTINTFVRSSNPNELKSVLSLDDPKTRPQLLQAQSVLTYPQMLAAFNGPTSDPDVTVNAAGVWFSGYAPILDAQKNSVGIVAVRESAQSVVAVQNGIKSTTFGAFAVVYLAFLAAILLISFAITRSLNRITDAARSLEKGEEYSSERLQPVMRSRDELGNLARIFDKMALEVRAREQKLRQQIADLRIEIDVAKRTQQVSEIADTDYFRDLQAKARQLRGQGAVSGQQSAIASQPTTVDQRPTTDVQREASNAVPTTDN
jgi:HAMP domain-containing protein